MSKIGLLLFYVFYAEINQVLNVTVLRICNLRDVF